MDVGQTGSGKDVGSRNVGAEAKPVVEEKDHGTKVVDDVKNMATVLPLVNDLHGDTMRERHCAISGRRRGHAHGMERTRHGSGSSEVRGG